MIPHPKETIIQEMVKPKIILIAIVVVIVIVVVIIMKAGDVVLSLKRITEAHLCSRKRTRKILLRIIKYLELNTGNEKTFWFNLIIIILENFINFLNDFENINLFFLFFLFFCSLKFIFYNFKFM